MNFVKAFFRAAPGAIRGHVNLDELCRILVLAVLAHQGVLAVLSGIDAGAATVFVNPQDAALYTAWLAAIVETVRRFHHGNEPIPLTKAETEFIESRPPKF